MSTLRNRVYLIGNLGADPETIQLENEKKMVKMSLATNETYKNIKGEKVTETQWHNLIVWGKQADTVEKYFKKGQEVVIEGKLVHRNYTAKDGTKRNVTEVQVMEFLLLGGKGE